MPIYAGYNFATTVVMPNENVMQIKAGESSFWDIEKTDHTVTVKPKLLVRLVHKKIDPTNINIITASGNVPCVVVSEVSGTDQAVDLKVTLEEKDPQALANIEHPEWVRAVYARELEKALAQSHEETAHVQSTAVGFYIDQIRHDYEWKNGKAAEEFGLKSIWHDDKFTYIEARSQDAPVLYEMKDGKDGKESIVQYTLSKGKYVVQHIIEHGRLKAGKKTLEFDRRVKESA